MTQTDSHKIAVGRTSQVDGPEGLTSQAAIHEAIELKCFFEGSATLLIETRSVPVKAGDVVVINPYEFHATVDTGEEKGKYHLFMLPLDYFSGIPELDLRKLFFAEEKKFRTLFRDDRELHSLLMQAAAEAEKKQPCSELMIKSLLMCFFTLLLRRGVTNAERAAPEKRSLRLYTVIEPALRCIKNDYARTLTVDELARLCSVSKNYFCRAFKSVTQKSAMEYLRDFRLGVANVMLANTGASIAEISACCGFESPNYFSRCYKTHFGESPRQSRTTKEENR